LGGLLAVVAVVFVFLPDVGAGADEPDESG
jgi:hypothetical protein